MGSEEEWCKKKKKKLDLAKRVVERKSGCQMHEQGSICHVR